jgi:hypothetical protein
VTGLCEPCSADYVNERYLERLADETEHRRPALAGMGPTAHLPAPAPDATGRTAPCVDRPATRWERDPSPPGPRSPHDAPGRGVTRCGAGAGQAAGMGAGALTACLPVVCLVVVRRPDRGEGDTATEQHVWDWRGLPGTSSLH